MRSPQPGTSTHLRLNRDLMQTLQIGDDWHTDRVGGLNFYFYELLRHLGATGTRVHGLVVGSDDVGTSTQGQVVAFASKNDSIAKRMLYVRRFGLDHILRDKIDIIATHFALYTLPLIDQLAMTPAVVHFHGPWAYESAVEGSQSYKSWVKGRMERSVYSRAKRLIVLSHAFKVELMAKYGIAENLIRVVPAGVDLQRFNVSLPRLEARKRLGWPTDRPILLTVRRQVNRMGLEELVEAAKLLVQQCPDTLVLMGGTGPLANELNNRIRALNLEQNVRCLGRVSDHDLPLAYRAADMTVVPSQALEGFGLITLESLASGTPVYVTPVGGLPETIRPFAPECIFENTGPTAIAQSLIEALQGRRPVPSEAACRAYCVDHYSWALIAQHVRSVYEEALA
jgi:glycosyltransferase involved in cell wall biosynthesis